MVVARVVRAAFSCSDASRCIYALVEILSDQCDTAVGSGTKNFHSAHATGHCSTGTALPLRTCSSTWLHEELLAELTMATIWGALASGVTTQNTHTALWNVKSVANCVWVDRGLGSRRVLECQGGLES